MPFDWHGLRFEGPFRQPGDLDSKAGVYVIWCSRGAGWAALDVGESGDVRARILSHDRKDCWRQNCLGEVMFAAHYTPGTDEISRRRIETQLRDLEHPRCGN